MADANELINIVYDTAQGAISKFDQETNKMKEGVDRVKGVCSNVGNDIWSGGRRQEFDEWFTSKFLPSAEDVAGAIFPGLGSALGQMLGVMGQAEGEMASTAQELMGAFKF
jgi:hypothetical protein